MEPADVTPSSSAAELRRIALDCNWDDGYAGPHAIADHPECDLGVALELFWLANAHEVYLGDSPRTRYNGDWHDFSQLIAARIVGGHYSARNIDFVVALSRVQQPSQAGAA